MTAFRIYEPFECGADGYPRAWHSGFIRVAGADLVWTGWMPFGTTGPQVPDNGSFQMGGVKDIVRTEAGDRCVRCGHPYVVGQAATWEPNRSARATARADSEAAPTLDGVGLDEIAKAKRATHWSPCDEHCRHGGPMRVDVGLDGVDWRYGDDLEFVAGPRFEAAWRILTVHHLNGRKHDLRWWNLLACCQRCHLEIQKKVTMEQVYPFEHTEWFKPYAAGWYAYVYLGEDLSREETMGRLDELLALERVT